MAVLLVIGFIIITWLFWNVLEEREWIKAGLADLQENVANITNRGVTHFLSIFGRKKRRERRRKSVKDGRRSTTPGKKVNTDST